MTDGSEPTGTGGKEPVESDAPHESSTDESVSSPDDSVDSDESEPSDGGPVDVSRSHPVLLFDGVCNLCNRWIQFVIDRDPDATFRFAPLQSDVADELLDATGYEGETLDSIVLVEDGEYYAKSGAVIRAGNHLGGVYRLLGPFSYVPRRIRDFIYDFVANRRYGWFGKRDACMRPTPDVEERFLTRE